MEQGERFAPRYDDLDCHEGADEYGRPYCAAHGQSWPCSEQIEARGHWPGDGCGPATRDHFRPPFGTGAR